MITEKLDGVRALWDGKKLLTKHGHEISCPDWFIGNLPSIPLDGELWMGRKMHNKLIGVIESQQNSIEWRGVKYLIFDLPNSQNPYKTRMSILNKLKLPSHATVVKYEICKGNQHMVEKLESIVSRGGEGLMMRDPIVSYIPGRTKSMLKVKVKVIYTTRLILRNLKTVRLRFLKYYLEGCFVNSM